MTVIKNVEYKEFGIDSTIISYKVSSSQLIVSSSESRSSHWNQIIRAFVPKGFPTSVSDDYISYQMWDTLQAFVSSIYRALATQAVLTSVGVGDELASPLAAALTWLLRHGCGMLSQIVFSLYQGLDLDYNCKKWRLFADVLNNVVTALELGTPFAPKSFVLPLLSLSGIGMSLVGVIGNGTRTAITQHQAIDNNISDVAAKDSSQETLVNLLALFVNFCLLPYLNESQFATWILCLFLCSFHIYANYKAVKSLVFKTLNRARLILVIEHYLQSGDVLSPQIINGLEPVFYNVSQDCKINLGTSISKEDTLSLLQKEMDGRNYFLSSKSKNHVNVILKQSADLIEAFFYAYNRNHKNLNYDHFKMGLEAQGWITSHCQLHTEGYFGTFHYN